MIETVEVLKEELEEERQARKELEEELESYRTSNELDKAHIRQRVTDIEEGEDEEPGSGDAPPGVEGGKTTLETLVSLPEEVAQKQLQANDRRARFIARDIKDYTSKCMAGYVMDSRDVKRVLSASDEVVGKAHNQTVSRVMDRLESYGGTEVTEKTRRGKRIVVVTEEMADRLHECCDRGEGPAPGQPVMPLE